MKIEKAKYPTCMMKDCNEIADYEFTDHTSEKLTYTIATTCSKHCEQMVALVGKARKMAFNFEKERKSI